MTTTGSKAASVVVCPDWEGGDALDVYHTIGKCAHCRKPWRGFNAFCPDDGHQLEAVKWWCFDCEGYPEPFVYHDSWHELIRFCPKHFRQLRAVDECGCGERLDIEQGAKDAGFSSTWFRLYACKDMALIAVTPELLRSLQSDDDE